MMTFSPAVTAQIPTMISPFTYGWGFYDESVGSIMPASASYESANRAVYFPIWVPRTVVAKRVFWANGSTVSGAQNVEVGIYSPATDRTPGTKLVSGSSAQGTANQLDFVDITDTTITPGLWYIAVSKSGTSTLMRSTVTFDASFRFEEASAYPLPSTATPVESSNTNIYMVGFSTTTIT